MEHLFSFLNLFCPFVFSNKKLSTCHISYTFYFTFKTIKSPHRSEMYHLVRYSIFVENSPDPVSPQIPKIPFSLSYVPAFLQVKVKNWVNGTEGTTVVGLSAKFGAPLPRDIHEAKKSFAVLANPIDCCSNLTSKVSL